MKAIHTIALFAGVLAVAMGAITVNGFSATSLTVGASQTNDNVGMLGHVEYVVSDTAGFIKSYKQGDNIVVEEGKDCVAKLIFENSTTDVDATCGSPNEFQHIAVGNFTVTGSAVNSTMTHLDATSGAAADCDTSTVDGEMARKTVSVNITPATGATGAVVVLDTSVGNSAFSFDANNATTVYQSGVFDRGSTADETCLTAAPPASNLFSIQDLNADTGIAVNNGDSLSIKWTITVG